MSEIKECSKCKTFKFKCHFYKLKSGADGLYAQCKECHKIQVSEYTRENIDKIVEKSKTPKGREIQKRSTESWVTKNRSKKNIHVQTSHAIRSGLIKKKNCEVCNESYLVDAHHDDYNKPLNIRWLCRKHHKKFHKEHEYVEETKTFIRK